MNTQTKKQKTYTRPLNMDIKVKLKEAFMKRASQDGTCISVLIRDWIDQYETPKDQAPTNNRTRVHNEPYRPAKARTRKGKAKRKETTKKRSKQYTSINVRLRPDQRQILDDILRYGGITIYLHKKIKEYITPTPQL